jgi:methylenetetrahydrofolate reductase (NADPH)
VEKVEAGADFILTQIFYDVNAFLDFESLLREHPSGAFKTIPIIPAIMPIQSYQSLKRITRLSHARIPSNILVRVENSKADDEAVKTIGVDVAVEMIQSLRNGTNNRGLGFHLCTLNLEKSVALVLENSGLLQETIAQKTIQYVAGDEIAVNGITSLTLNDREMRAAARRTSSITSDPHNRVIVDDIRNSINQSDMVASSAEAGKPPDPIASQGVSVAISEGQGDLGRQATWDEFPNGRFGDARSPGASHSLFTFLFDSLE